MSAMGRPFGKRKEGAASAPESLRALARSEGEARPVYLLFGEEEYLVEEAAGRLLSRLLPPGTDAEFSLETVRGTEATNAELGSALGGLPLFGGVRVVWLKRCEVFANASRAEAVLANLPPPGGGVTALITEEGVDRRYGLYKEIGKRGLALEFPSIPEKDTAGLQFLYERSLARLKADQIELSKETFLHLVQLVGTGMRTLLGEVEKLSLHAPPGGRIERADVDRLVTPLREIQTFELADAVAKGETRTALGLLGRLLEQRMAPLAILSSLVKRMRFLLQAAELLKLRLVRADGAFPSFKADLDRVPPAIRDALIPGGQMTKEEIARLPKPARELLEKAKRYSLFAQNPYVAYMLCRDAGRLPLASLRACLGMVLQADIELKGGRRSEREALEDLVLSLCARRRG